jgi:hypothetical protein
MKTTGKERKRPRTTDSPADNPPKRIKAKTPYPGLQYPPQISPACSMFPPPTSAIAASAVAAISSVPGKRISFLNQSQIFFLLPPHFTFR